MCGSPGGIVGHVRVPVVLVVHVPVLVFERLVRVLVLVPLGKMQHTAPTAISTPAATSCEVTGSPSIATASTAPRNGAVEK